MTPILRQWNATRYSRTIIYNLPTGFIQLIPAQFYSFYELTKIKCLHYDIQKIYNQPKDAFQIITDYQNITNNHHLFFIINRL